MNHQRTEQAPTLDLPWLLTGSFLVLGAGFTFVVFSLVFIAGADDVRFLGDVAAFVLIFTVVMFAVLLFVAANLSEPDEVSDFAEAEAAETESNAVIAAEAVAIQPGMCSACGQMNPQAANFCYHCGSRLERS